MTFPTWSELKKYYCSNKNIPEGDWVKPNPYYEDFACRRYNYAPSDDVDQCRLVFLQDVLTDPNNNTLRRGGRFVWCKNLEYAGRGNDGFRQISFTVDKGKKVFQVSENNVLSVPSKVYVNNNRYFRAKDRTFFPFSSVFSYRKALRMMSDCQHQGYEELLGQLDADSPFVPGTLVRPRLGYFYPLQSPSCLPDPNATHPCGIILGKALLGDDFVGREFYRVRFGDTTYEKVHPVQMEIINEV